jgi:predicted transcriptional regulator
MKNLFTIERKVEIIKLDTDDVIHQSDNLKIFNNLIVSHEQNYPEIEKWLKNKVLNGIKTGERTAWYGLADGKPIASAVVKHGNKSKFCHLHITSNERDKSLGDVFFSMMAIEIKRQAKDVFFTLPEGLWSEKRDFFESFGFKNPNKYPTQYRSGEEELICEVPFHNLWGNVLQKIPLIQSKFVNDPDSPTNGVIFSIQPKYAENIMCGLKKVEIRKKFDKKWIGRTGTIYATAPIQSILGYVKISNVVQNSPDLIWEKYSDKIGCSKEEFESYVQDDKLVFAIELSDVFSYPNPITLSWLNSWTNSHLKAPQSYSAVKNTGDWSNALSLSQMLHHSFTSLQSLI